MIESKASERMEAKGNLRTRRRFLASAGAAALLAMPGMGMPAWAQSGDAADEWMRAHAIPVRTVDALDEDFSDLTAVGRAIGNARVVQLGEPSHGAGTSFAAKVRLIKFLHQVMGFDVLVWESGFYDLVRTEAGLSKGDDAVAAAQGGILNIWSASEECRPLFEYAKKSHRGKRPLVMAGFDMQFTSNAFPDFAAELRTFVGAVRNREVRGQAVQTAGDAIDAFSGFNAYMEALASRASSKPPQPTREGLVRLQGAADHLVELFDRHKAGFAAIGGERRRGFMAHAVANLASYGANISEEFGADVPKIADAELVRENRRDTQNAKNLRWLVEEGYPGRKVIVWAHNVHVMNAYYGSDWKSITLDARPSCMKPMGVFLAEWLGKDVYTVGCTAFEGEDGWVGSKPTAVPAASEGSVEGQLHRLGHAYCFVDLRGARGAAGNPLHRPLSMRVPKYDEVEVADVTRPYDGLFFVDRMAAATKIK
jgi:erythromycin esterase